MIRSPLRLLGLTLLAGLILSGCARATLTPTPTPSASANPPVSTGTAATARPPLATGTLEAPIPSQASALRGVSLQVWHAFTGKAAGLFQDQVALFNSSNEWGITVTSTGYGDYPSLFDAVNTALGSGTGVPDLVAALPEQTLSWNTTRVVVDLNPYLGDPTWGLGSAALADIPAVFLAQDRINGSQLGVPAQRSAHFLYYNTTWAHELGFPDPPRTADEFLKQALAANAKFHADSDPTNDGYGGWIVDTSWETTYSWLLAFGGSVVDGTTYGFRTDPNLAALQFEKRLYDDHCAWLSTEPTPFDAFARRLALFVSGDLAEVPMAAESMSRLKNSDEWTLIPFPGPSGRQLVTYGPSYSLLKSTPEKQLAAWLFTRWLLSPQNQAQWVEATGLFALRSSVLDQVGPDRLPSPQWEAAQADLPLAQGVPQLASWRQVRYVLEDGATVIFRMNTPLDQLSSSLTEMDSMAQELNK